MAYVCAYLPGTAPSGAATADVAKKRRSNRYETRFPNDAGILTIDLVKTGFQVCAAASEGEAPSNRKFMRPKLEKFLEAHSPCPVAMEACSTFRTGGASLRPQATRPA